MAIGDVNVGQELLNVPMGSMIRQMALAIAEGQFELDKNSMLVAEMMSGQRLLRDIDTGELINPLPDNTPRVIDSRIYFGYTYQEERDEKGEIVYQGSTEEDKVPVMIRKPNKVSMMELGFIPNFYQFVDTIIEVKIAIKITGTTEQTSTNTQAQADVSKNVSKSDSSRYDAGGHSANSGTWWWGHKYHSWGYGASSSRNLEQRSRQTVSTSQVDANYSNKYSYSVEGASLLRTKLVPVPPPAVLEDRIREVMQNEREYLDRINAGEIVSKEQLTTDQVATSQ